MTITTDVVTPTSLGTSTTETRVNADTPYNVPSWARCMVEVTPFHYATGACTAAQSMTPKAKIKSVSIGGLEPKEFVIAPISALLGATSSNTTPVLKSFKINRGLPGANANIDFYGQNLVANTVANAMGFTVKLTDSPKMGKEQFWFGPTDETDSGTTAAVIDGANFTINNALGLNAWYGQLMPVTVVASESYTGFMELQSADFTKVQRVRFAPYQITAGLSTLITTIVPDQMIYEGWVDTNSTCTISNRFDQRETVNAAYDFWIGVGYQKRTEVPA